MTPERWERIKSLYDAARGRGEGDRAQFLAEACAGDEALRGEVQALLDQSVSTGSFVDLVGVPAPAAQFLRDALGANLTGQRLGVYQIQALVGRGGMGMVYRARDTRLDRDVALKVLPAFLAADPERRARFEREARLLAALNHPHIGAIYGVEEAGGSPALVLELVDGDTLANRLQRGALSVSEALRIARQIADALDAAHEKNIVHRDLKPANVKITPDGVVKVLDFGIAKVFHGDRAAPDLSQAPTVAATATRARTLLGTPAYMSPEQARGQPTDKRTDIWAFGCLLYEMLTGRAAFARDTTTDTLAAIVEGEPHWPALPPATPPVVRHLLRRCLDKDPKQRLRDIGDARLELDQLAAPVRHWRPMYRAAGLIVLALLLLTGGVSLLYLTRPSVPVTSPSEYTQITNFTDSAVAPSLSPDGRMVTFIRGGEFFLSRGQIYVKLLPNGESVRLTNDPEPKYGPVFTPDGSRIAYTWLKTRFDTWTVPVLGGQPTRFLPNASGLVWIADRRLLFAEIKPPLHMGIVTASESRADRREIYFPANERGMAHYAYASPDRQSVLVVEMDGTHHFSLPCRLVSFDGSSAGRQVGPRGTCTSAAWSPDGKWMYFSVVVRGSSHIWRQRFPDGAPEQITFSPTEQEGIALAPDGRSFVTSLGTRRSAIWIHDAAGERAITSEGYARLPRLSRDGTRVFYLLQQDSSSSSAELRTVDLGSGRTESVLPGVSVTDYDISRDETEVAYTTTDDSGESQIWLASLDRRTPPRQIARSGDQGSFGAEGYLVFRSLDKDTNSLVRIKKDGSGRERLATPPILDKYGVSPDGQWVIVFSLAALATVAVPVDGGTPRIICSPTCSPTGGRMEWSSDGRSLYVPIGWGAAAVSPEKTAAIPVPAGKSLPDLPASGIDPTASEVDLPGARVIDHGSISPGPNPSTYVFTKSEIQRNLFRIPLH